MDAANPRNRSQEFAPNGASARRSRDTLVCSSFPELVIGLLLALNFGGSGTAQAQTNQSQNEDSYTIRGTVVNSVTHAAVPRALVFSTDNHYAKLTDEEGHFEFKLPKPQSGQNGGGQTEFSTFSGPGTVVTRVMTMGGVILVARKPGYFQSSPGQPSARDEGESATDVTIELVPEALVTGRVNLAANDGTNTMQVTLYRRQVNEGHAQWVPANSTTTRANGDFRFANLQAGDYKLFTQDSQDRDPVTYNPRQLFGYAPVYYPGASDFESAGIIHLKAGDTFSATLAPSRTEYYPVRLGLANPALGGGINVEVETQGHRGPGFSLGYNPNNSSIQGLLPNGNYRLTLTKYGENGGTGALDFSVNGGPAQGQSVTLAPNSLIGVRLTDERTKADNTLAQGPRNLLNAMNISFVSTDGFGQMNYMRLRPPLSPEDETLVFADLHPGSYRVRSRCQPWGYVASLSSGGTNLLQQPLVVGIGAAVPGLEVTIRDDGAMLNGSIENWPPQGMRQQTNNFSGSVPTVVLLPTADSPGQFCQAWASPNGDFSFQQVAPGEYLALAFDHLPEDLEYDNAEAIKKLEPKGKRIRLVVDQKEHVQLTLNTGGGSD